MSYDISRGVRTTDLSEYSPRIAETPQRRWIVFITLRTDKFFVAARTCSVRGYCLGEQRADSFTRWARRMWRWISGSMNKTRSRHVDAHSLTGNCDAQPLTRYGKISLHRAPSPQQACRVWYSHSSPCLVIQVLRSVSGKWNDSRMGF